MVGERHSLSTSTLVKDGGLLLGRRSYQDLLAYWNTQDSPFRDALNNASSASARPASSTNTCAPTSMAIARHEAIDHSHGARAAA